MKVAVIFFHKNINSIYKKKWVDKCVNSIYKQTYNDFFVYEINYGNEDFSVVKDFDFKNKFFYKEELENYAEAMNYIITKAFEDGCNYVFNTNLDDFYDEKRIEKQLKILQNGFDVVSSDFCYIEDVDGVDKIKHHMKIKQYGDIELNLNKNHNVIAHPSVAINKRFWDNNRYDITKTPSEDLHLWKESIKKGFKFFIHDEELLFYRIHNNQVSSNKQKK
jgi:hypothetical protein